MPKSPRAFWPCGSSLVKPAHRQTGTGSFWLVVVDADGKYDQRLSLLEWCFKQIPRALPPFQANLGGNLRFALTASAPISPTVLSFLRATLGCLIFEGYGQTECTAGCTFSMPGDWTAGEKPSDFPVACCSCAASPQQVCACVCQVTLELLYLAPWSRWWTSPTWNTTLRTEKERWVGLFILQISQIISMPGDSSHGWILC